MSLLNLKPTTTTQHVIWLVVGDTLAFLIFVIIGRASHYLSLWDVMASLATATPFLLGWFLVAPWFGLFNVEVSQSWRQTLPRMLGAWAIGGPLAIVLRMLLLGRPLIWSFVITTLSITLAFLIIWRLGYIWWMTRQP